MMNEEQAKAVLEAEFAVSRETMARLERFGELLRVANAGHNLVSAASLDHLWARHFLDSAQLVRFAPNRQASWVDLGSGAGFPGMVVALLHPGSVVLVEERRLRVDFLRDVAAAIGVQVEIIGARVERVDPRSFDVISARAFAPLDRLLDLGTRFSTTNSVWILPKGRNAQSELEALDSSWQGDFRLEHSLTDPEAGIIVAEGVKRADKRKRR